MNLGYTAHALIQYESEVFNAILKNPEKLMAQDWLELINSLTFIKVHKFELTRVVRKVLKAIYLSKDIPQYCYVIDTIHYWMEFESLHLEDE